MKRINSYILTGGVIILGLCGCTSNFDDYNKDPNRAEVGKANSSQMLEDLIFEGAGSMKYRTWRHNNEFMQYTVETSTLNQLHRFVLTDSECKGAWNFCGRWAVNAIEMYKLAEKEENTNAQAIALTMKALYLSNMTDLFGDMPFKEAFKGIDENIMQPKFDDQKVIYDSLLMDLERANTLYTKTSTIDAKRDLLYNGDVTKWRKFTNSLYLRLLMRVSNRRDMNSAERIKTVFENPSQYPIFESNDDNATLKYSGTRPFVNDFGDNATDDSAMGERFINIMVDSSDPRISVYCNRVSSGANAGGYVGITSGAPASVISKQSADGASNSNNTTFRQYTSPYTFMTYSEVLFIKAEAIQRGMMDGEASETYYAAVTASLKQWIPDISESAVETFLQNGVHGGLRVLARVPPDGLSPAGDGRSHPQRRRASDPFPLPAGAAFVQQELCDPAGQNGRRQHENAGVVEPQGRQTGESGGGQQPRLHRPQMGCGHQMVRVSVKRIATGKATQHPGRVLNLTRK